MPKALDPALYARARAEADARYATHGAYKSAFIVKRYRELGGRYAADGAPRNLTRWLREKWVDVGGKSYPVYRPTVRVTARTPLTVAEVDPANLRAQIARKQRLGPRVLPRFVPRAGVKKAAPPSAAKKTAAKKTAAKKTAKKTAAKKTAKKAAAKKTAAKKAAAKKTAAKKATARRTARKTAAKKTTAKKTTARKTVGRSASKGAAGARR